MKKYFILLLLLTLAPPVLADDTGIYGISTINVKPNVLLIVDNSGSMSTEDMSSELYDKDANYPLTYSHPTWVYKKNNNSWFYYGDITSNKWRCLSAKEALIANGYWSGNLTKDWSGNIHCGAESGDSSSYRTIDYFNFLAQVSDFKARMIVAKEVVAKLIYDNSENINFGLMTFKNPYKVYYNYYHYYWETDGGYIVKPCGATVKELIGYDDDSAEPYSPIFTDADQGSEYGAIGNLYSNSMTPLAETLAEAGLYFAGKHGWFNNVNYTSPINYSCQKNYIILVTDGVPTADKDNRLESSSYINAETIPSFDKDGEANYLDDVSYYLANQDISDIESTGGYDVQNITTHTIGILGTESDASDLDFLQQVATNGNGTFNSATSAATLGEVLNNIITNIGNHNEQFTSTAVPVDSTNGLTAGDYVYFGLFQPVNNNNWAGNLKKYKLVNGVIQDVNGIDALSNTGVFKDIAQSFWSNTADGNQVTAGGAGGVLSDAIGSSTSRKIYTYTGTNNNLTDSSNLFITTNSALTDGTYAGLTNDVITAVRHEGDDTSWPLGSFIHSKPLAVHYGTSPTMIYVGGNDGMLHCFDDTDGSEKWGVIPQDLLSGLNVLESPTRMYYFVDGSPVLFSYDDSGSTKKVLIFGERRGGYSYTALDVSDPAVPSYKYSINSDVLTAAGGSEPLGQSWGNPQSCRMIDSTTNAAKDVFLLTGGYDTNQDFLSLPSADTMGRAVFAVDSKTGALCSNFNFNHSNFDRMSASIVAAAAFENPLSRTATRVYAGDLAGNLFAFRDDQYNGDEDGIWQQKIKLFSSPGGQKIFYRPNITNEYYWVKYPFTGDRNDPPVMKRIIGDYIFYGTGDRANPLRTDIINEFYAIKNNWQWENSDGSPTDHPTIIRAYVDKSDGLIKKLGTSTELSKDDDGNYVDFILDVTDDLLQNQESDEETSKLYTNYIKTAINLRSNRGWYIRLEGSGEKVVSTPTIFNGIVYFTTFIPDNSESDIDDPCATPGSSGQSRFYALGYKYGGAYYNLTEDAEGLITAEDRWVALSVSGMAPQQQLIITKKGDAFIQVGKHKFDGSGSGSGGGGGLVNPPKRFFWRQLNN